MDQLEKTADHYLVRTRMKNRGGEALLVDPGSPGNLAGDEWSDRMAEVARSAGFPAPTRTPLEKVLEVGGVGSGSQQATHSHRHHLALPGGQAATYEAPVLPNSSVPALLGRQTLREQRAVIDCFNNRMYRIGPGGYSLQLSPGSSQFQLEESHAGHLMLPCDLYHELGMAHRSSSKSTMALAAAPVSTASSTAPTSEATARTRTRTKSPTSANSSATLGGPSRRN